MNISSEFLRAIELTSGKELDDIESRIREYTAQRERESRENAEKIYSDYIREQSEKHSATGGGSEHEADRRIRLRIAGARKEIEDRTFAAAEQKAAEFTQTPAYRDFILASVNNMLKAAKGCGLTVCVRGADLKYADDIRALSPDITVETDDSIMTGGVKGRADGARLFMDDTLDTRLQAQREYFREFSGLDKI